LLLLLNCTSVSDAQAAAPSLGAASVTLTGNEANVAFSVNAEGLFTDTHVAYGTTPSLGSESPDVSGGSATTPFPLRINLLDLTAGATYYYEVVATNSAATATSALGTFTVPAPAIEVTLDPASFRAARSGPTIMTKYYAPIGTMIGYNDSYYDPQQGPTITFTVLGARSGVRSGSSCVAGPKHPRPRVHYRSCTRYVALGSFEHVDATGGGTVDFSGRIDNRALPAGEYKLTATPSADNVSGATITQHFRIVR
jgi:hypothetical protein